MVWRNRRVLRIMCYVWLPWVDISRGNRRMSDDIGCELCDSTYMLWECCLCYHHMNHHKNDVCIHCDCTEFRSAEEWLMPEILACDNCDKILGYYDFDYAPDGVYYHVCVQCKNSLICDKCGHDKSDHAPAWNYSRCYYMDIKANAQCSCPVFIAKNDWLISSLLKNNCSYCSKRNGK